MKLSKKGAVTLATALVVFLITTGLMLSRVKDLESSIICMECKDHLDSDDYLQLGYLNQELASAKKDLENGNYEL